MENNLNDLKIINNGKEILMTNFYELNLITEKYGNPLTKIISVYKNTLRILLSLYSDEYSIINGEKNGFLQIIPDAQVIKLFYSKKKIHYFSNF